MSNQSQPRVITGVHGAGQFMPWRNPESTVTLPSPPVDPVKAAAAAADLLAGLNATILGGHFEVTPQELQDDGESPARIRSLTLRDGTLLERDEATGSHPGSVRDTAALNAIESTLQRRAGADWDGFSGLGYIEAAGRPAA